MRKTALLILLVLSIPSFAHAQKSFGDAGSSLTAVQSKTGIEEKDVTTVTATVVSTALQVVGLIFFVLTVYAGFKWMLSRGNEEIVEKARNTIIACIIGLIITVSAYSITSFVTNRVLQSQPGVGSGLGELGSGDDSEPLGCCLSWTQGDFLNVPIASWKIMTNSQCKFMNEDVNYDPLNQNKFDWGNCPGPKNGCWLFYPAETVEQCEQRYNDL